MRELPDAITLTATRCAICRTEGNSELVYAASLDADAFTPAIFSARRSPDRIHYRIVRCLTCGLIRSDPVASDELLTDLFGSYSAYQGP